MISYGFFPMFGAMDKFSDIFDANEYDGNYSRTSCLKEKKDETLCPFSDTIWFSAIMAVIYLILMNLVFFNLIISSIKYKFYFYFMKY